MKTSQKVIRELMQALANHNYSTASDFVNNALNDAVRASSHFASYQDAKTAMKADQVAAEKEAVEEVLGSAYAGKTMADLSPTLLDASAKLYDTANKGNGYYNEYNDGRSTVERLIKERKAYIFLEKYCGIQLESKFWMTSSGDLTYWTGDTTGNVDTGAITGADANITLQAGDVVDGKIVTTDSLHKLAAKYYNDVNLVNDKLIIGTGTEKTDRSVVPEFGNKYTATTSQAQVINTGTRDVIVQATPYNDTIESGGADSIDSGAGNDVITANADGSSLTTGTGSDTVNVAANVNEVTITDINSNDSIKVLGNFAIGSARRENDMLILTDRTGTRQLRLGNPDSAKYAKLNGTTISNLLLNNGINVNSLSESDTLPEDDFATAEELPFNDSQARVEVDPNYKPSPIPASVEQSQTLQENSYAGAITVNLDDVEIESGKLIVNGQTVGNISNEFPNVSSFTKQGVKFYLAGVSTDSGGDPDAIQAKTIDELTEDQRTILAAEFKWWISGGLKLNAESFGIDFNSPTTMVREIGLYFFDGKGSSSTLASTWNWQRSSSDGKTTKLMIGINMDYYRGISSTNVDGESPYTSALLDRTAAHELLHAVQATNIRYFQKLPKMFKEGSAELAHGIDDERASRIFTLAYDSDRFATVLDETNTSVDIYAGGYMFLRYFAKQVALKSIADELDDEPDQPLIITLGAGNNNYTVSRDGETVLSGVGNDTINILAGSVSVDAGNGRNFVKIFGGELPPDFDGDPHNGENVSVTSGKAADTISIEGGYNVYVNSGGGADSIVGFGENDNITIQSGDGNDTVSGGNYWIGYFDLGAGNDKVNVGGDRITIKGGKGNDDISYSMSGRTSIDGGAGNDTIRLNYNFYSDIITVEGGRDNDQIENNFTDDACAKAKMLVNFNTGDGHDTITGLKSSDTIVIDGGNGEFSKQLSDNDVKIIVGEDSILLRDAANLQTLNILGTEIVTATDDEPEWRISDTSVSYGTASETYFVINGLRRGLTLNRNGEINGISLDDFGVITLSANVLGTTPAKVSGENYSLALGSDVNEPEVEIGLKPNGTTAKLEQVSTAGYTLSDDEKTITFTPKGTTTLATISGLRKGLTLDDLNANITVNESDKTITISADVLGTTKVNVTGNYKLELADDVPTEGDEVERFVISGSTASLKIGESEHYDLAANGKSISFVPARLNKTLFAIKGLAKGLKVNDDGTIDGIDFDGTTATLSANVLSKTKVTITGGKYYLAFGDDVYAAEPTDAEWKVSGTKAIYQRGISEGYALAEDAKSISYTAAKADKAVVTISGLRKNLTADDLEANITVDEEDKTITISTDVLGTTKVTVKEKDFSFVIDGDDYEPTEIEEAWTLKGTTATLSDGTTAGYTLTNNDRTITYIAAKAGKAKATLTGLAKGLKVNNDGTIDGINVDGNVITLSANVLDNKKVTVKGNYTLALDDDVETAEPEDDASFSRKGTTATLNAKTSAGYTLSDDEKSATYGKAKTTAIATIKGVKTDLDDDSFDGETIYLPGTALNKKVTVSGNVAFEFDGDFNKAAITGSKAADDITIQGSGVTVTAGNGDDTLTSGSGGNTFNFSAGDGDDVIVDFTAGDKFKVTKGKITSVTTDDEDIIIAIQQGTTFDKVILQDAAYWFDDLKFSDREVSLPANLFDNDQSLGAVELATPRTNFVTDEISVATDNVADFKTGLKIK